MKTYTAGLPALYKAKKVNMAHEEITPWHIAISHTLSYMEKKNNLYLKEKKQSFSPMCGF